MLVYTSTGPGNRDPPRSGRNHASFEFSGLPSASFPIDFSYLFCADHDDEPTSRWSAECELSMLVIVAVVELHGDVTG
jgi:hypothetical protein